MEPGLPVNIATTATNTQRLPSFRPPRDLTLGGNVKTEKPKKVYMPNLNAQRNKKKDEVSAPNKVEPTRTKDSVSREHGRGRGKGDRGCGRGNLIQSVGVWSEGIYVSPVVKKYSGSRESSASRAPRKSTEKPKPNLRLIKKTEDEENFKDLLGDDSNEDNDDPDIEDDFLTLPINENGGLYKKEIKEETNDNGDEENIDRKPVISENGEVMSLKREGKLKVELKGEKKEPVNQIPQIIENKNNSYILIQFPKSLPGLEFIKEDPKSDRPNNSKSNARNEKDETSTECTLRNLRSGLLGKLEILKSGKTRLLLGENIMSVEVGSRVTTRQDLLAAKVDNLTIKGELVYLGPVSDTLVCCGPNPTLLDDSNAAKWDHLRDSRQKLCYS